MAKDTTKEVVPDVIDVPLPVESQCCSKPRKMIDVRHVQRTLAGGSAPDGRIGADDLNRYLRGFFEMGWEIFSVHTLGVSPEGTNLLYVLVMYQ